MSPRSRLVIGGVEYHDQILELPDPAAEFSPNPGALWVVESSLPTDDGLLFLYQRASYLGLTSDVVDDLLVFPQRWFVGR